MTSTTELMGAPTTSQGIAATHCEEKSSERALAALPAGGRAVLAKFFRGAGHPVRLALLEFLSGGEHNGNACVEHVGLSQGRVATHLACLTDCGFITARRSGRFVYYRVADPRVQQLVLLARSLAAENAASLASCTRIDDAPPGSGGDVISGESSREQANVAGHTEAKGVR